MYPTEIAVDEKAILKLTATYKRVYSEIVKEIESATNFGVMQRKSILSQIEDTLTELGDKTQKVIEQEIPKQYKSGADDAVLQLKKIAAPLRVSSGFSLLHKQAVEALVSDTAKAFGESMTGVNRSANLILNKGVKEEITQRLAAGQIRGEAVRKTKQTVMNVIREQGLDALVDKGGHSWTLDRYTEMLIRTKSVEARNRGLINRMVENNYDLVQVSRHGATDVCGSWEGKILSMTGNTRGYPTVSDAENDGLFHPNCKHAINVLHLDLARETMGWDMETQEYKKGLLIN